MPEQVNVSIADEWRAAEGDERREIRCPADGQLIVPARYRADPDFIRSFTAQPDSHTY